MTPRLWCMPCKPLAVHLSTQSFVHISTLYCNCNRKFIKEQVYENEIGYEKIMQVGWTGKLNTHWVSNGYPWIPSLLLLFYVHTQCGRGGGYSLSGIGLTIYLNWKRELTSLFFTDLSHFRWRNSREAAALPDWRDAKHVYHDQEVCREFGQSSCLSYARGHLSTAHR